MGGEEERWCLCKDKGEVVRRRRRQVRGGSANIGGGCLPDDMALVGVTGLHMMDLLLPHCPTFFL
jgi:hypothetical protein